MSKHIIIVESPAKAGTIEKYLGKDYKVLASYGHVRDLPSKEGSVDVENNFAMNYKVSDGAEKTLKAIESAVKKAETLYLATDLDREGEAISWHVLEEIKRRLGKKFDALNVQRITFSEITKTAVQNAIKNPRKLDTDLIDAQQARRALDYLVGFTLSPVLWRKVRPGLSAGRVQSVALRLICERENEIEAFKADEYWSIEAQFGTPASKNLTARLAMYDGKKVEKFSFTNEKDAKAAEKALASQQYVVEKVEKKAVRRFPTPPFITSTLQQEAARKLGFTARKTMSTAQRLYEAGHITYMRTDAVNLASEALSAIRNTIDTRYGTRFMPKKPNFYKTKSANAQEAHEAIRPSVPSVSVKELKGVTDADQLKLYDLIWKRTLACQMSPAEFDQTTLILPAKAAKHSFRASGRVMTFEGFTAVYLEGRDDATDDDDDKLLPAVSEGDALDVKKIMPEQHFTEPPPRYSESSLVKTLEEYSIGRPSTYASIISVLRDRNYVRIEARRFFPEDVGRIVSKFLTEHFETYVDYHFTAKMEEDLDKVARGEKPWVPLLSDFWTPFKAQAVEKTETVKKRDVTTEDTDEDCPTCKTEGRTGEAAGHLVIRLGRYGRFKACSTYPECKHAEPLDGSKEAGPKEPPKETGVTCPKCEPGEIVQKKSRYGKIFYSCNQYPKCKQAMWDMPIKEPCPQCNFPNLTLKQTKRYGEVRKCPECNWQDKQTDFRKNKPDPKAKKPAAKKAPAKKKSSAQKSSSKKSARKKESRA